MIRKARGKTKYMWFPVTESCPMAEGSIVRFLSGKIAPGLRAMEGTLVSYVGVLRHKIASTDSNYATARNVEVEVPVENNVEWEVDFDAGLATTDLGLFVDLYDSTTFNRGASAFDVAQVTKVISATKGYVVLNIGTTGFGSIGAA
jgi:hypothetical protein